MKMLKKIAAAIMAVAMATLMLTACGEDSAPSYRLQKIVEANQKAGKIYADMTLVTDGEECVCVQSISYSLLCRWFRAAVLPQDKELETALFHRLNAKKCAVCGALFTPGSNRAKYCPECAARMKRINAAKRKRKQREKCHALGAEKPL